MEQRALENHWCNQKIMGCFLRQRGAGEDEEEKRYAELHDHLRVRKAIVVVHPDYHRLPRGREMKNIFCLARM